MFVRWQIYKSRARNPQLREWNDAWPCLRAVLVEIKCIDGKPQEKHVSFLGSIDLRCDAGRAHPDHKDHLRRIDRIHRWHFWRATQKALDRLDNRMTAEDRAKIEDVLAKRVPRLSPEETAQREEERRAFFAEYPEFDPDRRQNPAL